MGIPDAQEDNSNVNMPYYYDVIHNFEFLFVVPVLPGSSIPISCSILLFFSQHNHHI